jgi:hypothetical protein
VTASAGEFARVRGLLARTPGVGPWVGASPERIAGLEAAVGYALPAALRAWLAECDGVIASYVLDRDPALAAATPLPWAT